MDLVGYDQATFDAIVVDYTEFANSIVITVSQSLGSKGDNITAHSAATQWYSGPTLIALVEGV